MGKTWIQEDVPAPYKINETALQAKPLEFIKCEFR